MRKLFSAVLEKHPIGARTAACSSDVFGDNYGAQWFLNNFCNGGPFRNCATSKTIITARVSSGTSFLEASAMNADFGSTTARYEGWAGSTQVFGIDVLPRTIETWSISGGSGKKVQEISGNNGSGASCHEIVHMAARSSGNIGLTTF